MFVCRFDCLHASKTTRPDFAQFSVYTLPVAMALSSSGGSQCDMLCTSGFVDDVMISFSYNAGNMPASKTTRMFRPISPGGGTGGKVCRRRLHAVNVDWHGVLA